MMLSDILQIIALSALVFSRWAIWCSVTFHRVISTGKTGCYAHAT